MHPDPFLLNIVAASLGLLAIAFLSRLLRQPHVVGYLAAGMLLGPHGLGLLTERQSLSTFGRLGVLLLLFFVGLETSPRQLLARWRVTFLGTAVQIVLSVVVMAAIGAWLHWQGSRIVLLGFVLSLSSTALVLNVLRSTDQTGSKLGRDALGILLIQDLAVIPMLVVIDVFADDGTGSNDLKLQATGAALAIGLLIWLFRARTVRLPLVARFRDDPELQIFLAFALCLGFALIAEAFELSAALGAFLAGMLLGADRNTDWVVHRIEPFRVVFVAMFFASIGLLVRLDFVLDHLGLVLALTTAVLVVNTAIGAAMFRALGDPLRYALIAGACLAQIGEFSFVLAAAGERSRLITQFEYRLTLAVITASLMLSPAWIALIRALADTRRRAPPPGADPAALETTFMHRTAELRKLPRVKS